MGSVRISWPRYSLDELLARLSEGVGLVARTLPVRRAVLFGSWATGRQTAASDVDLLVVYAGPPRPDAYALCRRLIRVRGLEPHVYAEEECAARAPVVERMVAGGIPIPVVGDRERPA